MECPRCKKTDISVIDSRDADSDTIRRRRECDHCRVRFTTYERIEPVKLLVTKRNGTTEPYVREKIVRGLERALEKRGFGAETIQALADRIEMKVLMCVEKQLTSHQIGEYVMYELGHLDQVAYLRFASVYRSFASIDAFEQEVAQIRQQSSTRLPGSK